MRPIPAQIQTEYKALLVKKAIAEKDHFYSPSTEYPAATRLELADKSCCGELHYIKWLRYYLDFCHKYDFKQSNRESIAHFIKKLWEKNHTEKQQEQASDEISCLHQTSGIFGD